VQVEQEKDLSFSQHGRNSIGAYSLVTSTLTLSPSSCWPSSKAPTMLSSSSSSAQLVPPSSSSTIFYSWQRYLNLRRVCASIGWLFFCVIFFLKLCWIYMNMLNMLNMLHKNFGRQLQNFSHKKDIKFIREYVIREYVNFGSHPIPFSSFHFFCFR
jgi:hypothetical protein